MGGLARKYSNFCQPPPRFIFFLKHGRFDQCSRSPRSSVNNNRGRYDHVFFFVVDSITSTGRFDRII